MGLRGVRGEEARRWASVVLAPLLALLLAVCGAVVAAVVGAAPAQAAACGNYVAGRAVYDCAGALTASQLADLEHRAAAVRAADAPVVIYLAAKDTSFDETLQDAATLMQPWDVESRPAAGVPAAASNPAV